MKRTIAGLGLALGLLLAGCATIPPQYGYDDDPSVDDEYLYDEDYSTVYFYDDLTPYGDWVDYPTYGGVWRPHGIAHDWRPYSDGRWVWTDLGWTWDSYEPWGGIVFHYGHWFHDPSHGWLWVSGRHWAPAWVTWRDGHDHIGWAPMPPRYHWRHGGHDRHHLGPHGRPGPEHYSFVEKRHFLEPHVRNHLIDHRQNDAYIHRTADVTRYIEENHRIVNRSVALDPIQRHTPGRIPPQRLIPPDDRAPMTEHRDDGVVVRPPPAPGTRFGTRDGRPPPPNPATQTTPERVRPTPQRQREQPIPLRNERPVPRHDRTVPALPDTQAPVNRRPPKPASEPVVRPPPTSRATPAPLGQAAPARPLPAPGAGHRGRGQPPALQDKAPWTQDDASPPRQPAAGGDWGRPTYGPPPLHR